MKAPGFRHMSPEDFEVYRPITEREVDAYQGESDFRKWCMEFSEGLLDEGARERYEEWLAETAPEKFFGSMDKSDLAGWQDNMTKD